IPALVSPQANVTSSLRPSFAVSRVGAWRRSAGTAVRAWVSPWRGGSPRHTRVRSSWGLRLLAERASRSLFRRLDSGDRGDLDTTKPRREALQVLAGLLLRQLLAVVMQQRDDVEVGEIFLGGARWCVVDRDGRWRVSRCALRGREPTRRMGHGWQRLGTR